jgi:hypothetical protein
LDTASNTLLDELEKAGPLFRVQKRTFLNQMIDNPILRGRLQVLDFFLLHFDSPFVGSHSGQKINKFALLFTDRLSHFVQLPDELIPVGLESRQLLSGEIKLEKGGVINSSVFLSRLKIGIVWAAKIPINTTFKMSENVKIKALRFTFIGFCLPHHWKQASDRSSQAMRGVSG